MDRNPEPLEAIELIFNYEPGALRHAGVDPASSEGKTALTALLLKALQAYTEILDHAAWLDHQPNPARLSATLMAKALLAEGP